MTKGLGGASKVQLRDHVKTKWLGKEKQETMVQLKEAKPTKIELKEVKPSKIVLKEIRKDEA